MTFAENGGFLMALLFVHFISSRVHRRVTRLAVSLPCTSILKNNREFLACFYILRKSELWNLTSEARYVDPGQAKKWMQMEKN